MGVWCFELCMVQGVVHLFPFFFFFFFYHTCRFLSGVESDLRSIALSFLCLKLLPTPNLSRLITFTLNRVHCPVQAHVVGGAAVAYQRQPKIRWFGFMVLIRSYPTRSRKSKTKNARFSRPARTVVSPSHPASSTGRESSSTQSLARPGVRFPV